jgi:hypothetical protein
MEIIAREPVELTESEMNIVAGGSNVCIGNNSSQTNQSVNHVSVVGACQISMGNNNLGMSGNLVKLH